MSEPTDPKPTGPMSNPTGPMSNPTGPMSNPTSPGAKPAGSASEPTGDESLGMKCLQALFGCAAMILVGYCLYHHWRGEIEKKADEDFQRYIRNVENARDKMSLEQINHRAEKWNREMNEWGAKMQEIQRGLSDRKR
jgi:hypothetical protein